MTEKDYGGTTNYGSKNKVKNGNIQGKNLDLKKNKPNSTNKENIKESSDDETNHYIKAGKILSETVKYARSLVKKDMLLRDIAEKIEKKIFELGGKPAFPVNLSINEVAAHDTPSWNDERKSFGLLKVDIGVHIEGYSADTAFSLDLENNEENKKLIESAEIALNNAIKLVKDKKEIKLSEIGSVIESSIKEKGFQPIQNLSGHSIERYNLHAGVTVPNFSNSSDKVLENGVYAIEPFSTTGLGSVRDGKLSGIYHLENPGNVRDSFAREVLSFIFEGYQSLPFCSRWIYNKFGSKGLLALRQIEQSGLLHHYPQLIEKNNGKVAQAEHTIIIKDKEKIITTA